MERPPQAANAVVSREYVTHAKLLRGFHALVAELGGDPDALLAAAGITGEAIAAPLAMIPVRALGELLEDSAAVLGCPDLGMRLAERHDMRPLLGPLERMFDTAPTIGDALRGCMDHMSAFNSGLVMELGDEPTTGRQLLDFRLLDGLALFPQMIELLLLLTHNSVIWLSAGFAQSRTVWLSHLAISPPVAYARRFNAVIEFGQEYDGLLFGERDLAARVSDQGPEPYVSARQVLSRHFPSRRNEVDMQVRQAVFRVLTRSGDCTRQNVARVLGFQERTLNRHLSKRGTSFEAIRDEVRRDLAFRYLARVDLPLTEVAGRLGYSELAVLSRCCQRWFGTSPRRLRQSLQVSRRLPAAGAVQNRLAA